MGMISADSTRANAKAAASKRATSSWARAERRRSGLLGSALIAPAGLVLLVFWAVPLVLVIAFSFFHWTDGTMPQAAGFDEYRLVLSSGLFWQSLGITVVFTLATVFFGTIISLLLALLLHAGMRATGMFRTILFLPYVTPVVATSTVWLFMLQPQIGVVNRILAALGLSGSTAWLNSPNLALLSLIVFTVWYSFGFTTLLFLAGLSDIPGDCIEAARVDGATAWQRTRWIILPLLSPTTVFIIVINTINAFQSFTQIYALTQGGPDNGTTTLTYLIYQTGFKYFHFGQASATATLFSILLGVLVLIQFRLMSKSNR